MVNPDLNLKLIVGIINGLNTKPILSTKPSDWSKTNTFCDIFTELSVHNFEDAAKNIDYHQ